MKSKTNWHRHRERQRKLTLLPFQTLYSLWVYHSGPYFTKKKKNPNPRLEFLIKTTTERSLITTALSTPHYPIHISHQNPQKSSHKTKKIPFIWVHNACESELEVEKSRWERERKEAVGSKEKPAASLLAQKAFSFCFLRSIIPTKKDAIFLSISLSLSLSL